jgi:hypothetical protein
MGKCLGKQGRRQASEKGIYLNAINYNPQRPEAYFVLSQYYESRKEWFDAYTTANIGLQYIDNSSPTLTSIEYPGIYGLLFQKAVCSWWIGQTDESRKLFSEFEKNSIASNNDYKCNNCRKTLVDREFECDHIIPLANGGKNTVENLQALCKNCHKNKTSIEIYGKK